MHTTSADGTASSELSCLVTDLLDVEAWPALDLACAYPARWTCETVIGHHKPTSARASPSCVAATAEGVAQEMRALFAAYQACTSSWVPPPTPPAYPREDEFPARPNRDRLDRCPHP